MFVMRQVAIWGVGVAGFALGIGAGMSLSSRPAPPREPRSEERTEAFDPIPPPAPPTPASLVPPSTALPPAPMPVAKITSRPSPGCWYTIGPSDTFIDVARRAYGGTRRVPDLRAANPALDPQHLRPGTLMYVPIAAEPVPPSPRAAVASRSAAPVSR